MNPNLENLHPYPFAKLAKLKTKVSPAPDKSPIFLSLGEPKHPIPAFITDSIVTHVGELAKYPTIKGIPELRVSIAAWLCNRFRLPSIQIDIEKNVLPVMGTREALFSIAQCTIDPADKPLVIMPNPFYQIYEGAAFLAGAEPYYVDCPPENDYQPDFNAIPENVWSRCQLLYLCSPGNPTGAVVETKTLKKLIHLADRYDFIIASDECYSEIYLNEETPPSGLLEAAYSLGNEKFRRCIVFNSLSKRSNAPGLRSGFVAGDSELIERYYQYRTYHGCAMPIPFQYASVAAWNDEPHVLANRNAYREKFSAVIDILRGVLDFKVPTASFFLWPQTPIEDEKFALELFATENVTVLPGSYLSREQKGVNPGQNHVRIALVEPLKDCVEAAHRIKRFVQS